MAERPNIGGSTAYQVLDVDTTADAKTIKKRYHQIARHWHPDVPPGREVVFGHVVRSYQLLTNAQQRR